MRWAGRGNGRIGVLSDVALALLSFLDMLAVGVGWSGEPSSVSGRVRYILRGGPDAVDGLWQEIGGSRVPVTVVHGGKGRYVESLVDSTPFTVSIAALTPLGTLDFPPRPRATTELGNELESGIVLRTEGQIATLLLRKRDVAVIAVLAGWPSPADLPHGQNAQEIVG
jgi:hypothetical protein